MGVKASRAVLDPPGFGVDPGRIPAARSAQRIERAVTEQAVEAFGVSAFMTGEKFTGEVGEKRIMLSFPRFAHGNTSFSWDRKSPAKHSVKSTLQDRENVGLFEVLGRVLLDRSVIGDEGHAVDPILLVLGKFFPFLVLEDGVAVGRKTVVVIFKASPDIDRSVAVIIASAVTGLCREECFDEIFGVGGVALENIGRGIRIFIRAVGRGIRRSIGGGVR